MTNVFKGIVFNMFLQVCEREIICRDTYRNSIAVPMPFGGSVLAEV